MTAASTSSAPGPVMCIVGARPNFMKMAPILRALAAHAPGLPTMLVHTGQHYDRDMSDRLFTDLGLPRPDINLDVGSSGAASGGALRSAPRTNGHDISADLSRIGLDPELANRLTRHLTALVAEQGQAQLQRVEASMLRVERLSQNTLATLLKLVSAVKPPASQDENPS